MNDDDLRPCPFCREKFTIIQDQYGTWSLDHPKNGCLLDNYGLETTYWYSRDVLVGKINTRPIEDGLRGVIRWQGEVIHRQDRWITRLEKSRLVVKTTKEVQKLGRWWPFGRK